MTKDPSNAVLLEKLESFEKFVSLKFETNEASHKQVNDHLKTLNGQVGKNTEFRIRGAVYVGIFSFVIPFIVTYFLN